jgi:(E)-4-hydroxy-3-methylbut-2-enyl-diphosphate synthase
MITRRLTRQFRVGGVPVGSDSPVSVQSMTKVPTEDVDATVRQTKELESVGCEIIRVAVPNVAAARAIRKIVKRIRIPLEADIHFNAELALEAIKAGADAVRINPGNIPNAKKVAEVAKAARRRRVPIRVGVNSGSVGMAAKISGFQKMPQHEAMVEIALACCSLLESSGMHDIMVSLKASDVISTVAAYRGIASRCDYPLHLGVTATGPEPAATVKSSIAMGALLLDGIGDTIRVSISGPPADEVKTGYEILRAIGLRQRGPEIIACPTCGRCSIDVIGMAKELQTRLAGMKKPLKIAVMGCVVNGPGEAKEADVGIAGGRRFGVLFKKGRKIGTVEQGRMLDELVKAARSL